ncbi:unnamed protein product [Caenorhabditis angaria]|uniref:PDZ domain-containing protein n=1 Tax=Caenorhabditis angaria TaxID=860376 RepID=A0A9P1IAZ8_9PELO|nr:unnamed protein product [Caenorhabditis angaria]
MMNNNNNNNNCGRFQKRSRSRSMFRNRDAPLPIATIDSRLLEIKQQHQMAVALPSFDSPVIANAPVSVNPLAVAARELKFACQLAHGSPVAIIEKWSDMSELYQSIADCFDINKKDIIYLTVNDFKLDMRNLFTGTLNFKDMLYAHIRGQAVELELVKDSDNFGVTITDNGLGNAFIKIINPGSIFHRASPATMVGQLIEKINGETVLGYRHYQVAKILRSIKKGDKCTLRLISPKTANQPMKEVRKPANDLVKGTIRFKSDGGFAVENIQDQMIQAEMCGKLNELFDAYLGVQDDQLAMRIWETAVHCNTLWELSDAIKKSELAMFDFPDGLVFDMWGIIGDLKREQNASRSSAIPIVKNTSRQSAMSIFH